VRLSNNGGDLPLQEAFYNDGFAGERACHDTIYVHPVEAISY